MGLSHKHAGPKILAKIQIYILTRAELLFTLCPEIPYKIGQPVWSIWWQLFAIPISALKKSLRGLTLICYTFFKYNQQFFIKKINAQKTFFGFFLICTMYVHTIDVVQT